MSDTLSGPEQRVNAAPTLITSAVKERNVTADEHTDSAAREKNRAYAREWYAKNPDKVREYAERHKKSEKGKLRARQYRESKGESLRAYHRAWKAKNKARCAAYTKKYKSKDGNREKRNAKTREWQRKNPDRVIANARRARGLPTPTRPRPDACECCGNSSKRAMHLDHSHDTGAFRGWLCFLCNCGIGKLGDSIEGLERAIAYLRKVGA